jgi:hypothetical protein
MVVSCFLWLSFRLKPEATASEFSFPILIPDP